MIVAVLDFRRCRLRTFQRIIEIDFGIMIDLNDTGKLRLILAMPRACPADRMCDGIVGGVAMDDMRFQLARAIFRSARAALSRAGTFSR